MKKNKLLVLILLLILILFISLKFFLADKSGKNDKIILTQSSMSSNSNQNIISSEAKSSVFSAASTSIIKKVSSSSAVSASKGKSSSIKNFSSSSDISSRNINYIKAPTKTINFKNDENGFLRFYSKETENYASYYYTYSTSFDPFKSLEVEVKKDSGSRFMFGIIFCYENDESYYRLIINTDGSYEILKKIKSKNSWYNFRTQDWQSTNSFTYPVSKNLKTGYGVLNKIKIISAGRGYFDIYFNDVKSSSFFDLAFSKGKNGINISALSFDKDKSANDPIDVKFKLISAD